MAEMEALIEHLKDNSDKFKYLVGEHEGKSGIYIENIEYDFKLHFTDNFINENSIYEILIHTHGGRNVEQATRVTGFFSKVKGWNKGKTGELKERYKSGLEGVTNE